MNIIYIADADSVFAIDRFNVLKKTINPKYIKFIGFIKEKNIILRLVKNLFLLVKIYFLIKIKKVDIVIHLGVYQFILNLLSYTSVSTIAIPQGSEINQLYKGHVKFLTDILLSKSKFILVRSKGMEQRLLFIKPDIKDKIHILNWGIKDIFFMDTNFIKQDKSINIISYRATGTIYNIDIIFEAIKKLKLKYENIKFIYVEYNKSIDMNLDLSICDEIYNNLQSNDIAMLLKKSDISLSIPSYDGFSTSLIESMAAGILSVISDIEAYKYDLNESPWLLKKTDIKIDSLLNVIIDIIENKELINMKKERSDYIKKYYSRASQTEMLKKIIFSCKMDNKQ